ncbi:MAG TPA: oxidoreductase [Steroidobacteraceae bacterium]
MQPFRAYRIHRTDGRIEARFDTVTLDDLTPGEVVVRVRFSTINFKDALAATGKSPILRKYPLAGGIDLAGEVVSSADARFKPGQAVLVNGCGLSETQDGGYSEYSRLQGDWVIPVPAGLTLADTMKIGTAGFTAALAVHRMEQNGQKPSSGPILVNGATGGVGSLAINMLAGRGYEVVALSSKADADDYLKAIGAGRILRRQELSLGTKPMESPLWAGAIDNLGGDVLTWLTRTVQPWGNVASIGLAASHELHTTVMPFILRGVSLLGINSVATPRDVRLAVWNRLATDLKPAQLDRICHKTVSFDELPAQFDDYIQGKVTGRTLVTLP